MIGKNKDALIAAALKHLDSYFGPDTLVLMDYWEADRRAVGVANPSLAHSLAHIAINPSGNYEVSIECRPPSSADFPYEPIGTFECGTLDALCWVIGDFLCIEPIAR